MKKIWILCVTIVLAFSSCAAPENMQGSTQEKTTLVLASFGENRELDHQVSLFNQNNNKYQIVIKQYLRFNQEAGDGIERLQREIVSGNGPDLINFGREYSITDILGEYTEDLIPYIETFSSEEQTTFYSNVLQAFSYQGGLYAIPVSFTLKTFAGRSTVIGNAKSWSVDELIACYQKEHERVGNSFMLYPGETKRDVFGTLLMGSVQNFVNWEDRVCYFDGADFKKILEFSNKFPANLNIADDFSPIQFFSAGEVLLYPVVIQSIYDICNAEIVFDDEVVYIGYPTENDCGTVVCPSELILAINKTSEHKEIAWEFISQFLEEGYQENIDNGLPVNKNVLERQLENGLQIEYADGMEGDKIPVIKSEIVFEGETPIKIYNITEKQKQAIMEIVESVSIGSGYDSRVHAILLEEADEYFSGDKTLDQIVQVIQSRTQIFVGE